MRDAPPYPHGATIPLDSARWIASHRVNKMESASSGILLTAGNASHRLDCGWGIELGSGGNDGIAKLIMPVQNHVDDIIDWEAAHPGQHPVAAREGSYRHVAWSGLRSLKGEALQNVLDADLANAASVRHDGMPASALHLRPAGTAPHALEGGAFIVAATLGSDTIRHAPGDIGVIAIGHAHANGVRWLHVVMDQNIVDIASMMDDPVRKAA